MTKRRIFITITILTFLGVLACISITKSKKSHHEDIRSEHYFVKSKQDLPVLTQHEKDVKLINETGEYIRLGNSFDDNGEYEKAAGAYKTAYSLDRGFRAVSGLKLAMTLEKLRQYDDAVFLLNQMIQNGELSANGVKNANTIKSRLLAAKAQSLQNQTAQAT